MEKKKKSDERKPARNLTARKLTKKELTDAVGGGGHVALGCCTQGCCVNDK